MSWIKDVYEFLVPPFDADPAHIDRWRINVATTLGIIVASQIVHIALACGFIPMFSPGFALASDVEKDTAFLRDIRVDQVARNIREYRKSSCNAKSANNPEAQRAWNQQYQEELDRYQRLTKRDYPTITIANCDDL